MLEKKNKEINFEFGFFFETEEEKEEGKKLEQKRN